MAKIVLVTGAAGGMGREIVKRFLDEACTVVGFDINSSALSDLSIELGANGRHFRAYTVDISVFATVAAAVASVEAEVGPIDILVNNAGWDRFRNFLDTDEALRSKVLSINLNGPINVLHAVLTHMAARGKGRVVTIASDAGRIGSSGQAVYSACKGGVIALTKSLARELARKGILLNVVCPGPTQTAMLEDFYNQGAGGAKVADAMVRAIPLKRIGRPEDIPAAVLFFASEGASFITGQVISVSGGLTMHG